MAKQPDDKNPVGLDGFLSDDLAPAFWTPELLDEPGKWWPHVPFAFWLVTATRPRVIVDLGVERGVSYSAFCEAARRLQPNIQCHAVDPWLGGESGRPSGDRRFDDFTQFHDHRYASFSQLMRMSSAAALDAFADGSIDLLHIDASGQPDEAREDYSRWRVKMSPSGVVLIHGVRSHGDRLDLGWPFDEISDGAPRFLFPQGEGLALFAAGGQPPEAITKLGGLGESETQRVRQRFAFLGARWAEAATIRDVLKQFESDIQTLTAKDDNFRLTLADRTWNSLVKTVANPFRYFDSGRRQR